MTPGPWCTRRTCSRARPSPTGSSPPSRRTGRRRESRSRRLAPELLLVGGDVTRDGSIHRWELEEMRRDFRGMGIPYHVIPGNMDTGNKHTRQHRAGPDPAGPRAQHHLRAGARSSRASTDPSHWSIMHRGLRVSGFCDMLLGSGLPEEADAVGVARGPARRSPDQGDHVFLTHYAFFIDGPDEDTFDITRKEQYLSWYFGLDKPVSERLLAIGRRVGPDPRDHGAHPLPARGRPGRRDLRLRPGHRFAQFGRPRSRVGPHPRLSGLRRARRAGSWPSASCPWSASPPAPTATARAVTRTRRCATTRWPGSPEAAVNSRERILAAFARQDVDHVPCSIYFNANMTKHGYDPSTHESTDCVPGGPGRGPGGRRPLDPRAAPPGGAHAHLGGPGRELLYKEYATPAGTLRVGVRLTPDWPFGQDIPFPGDDFCVSHMVEPLVKGPQDVDAYACLLRPPTAIGRGSVIGDRIAEAMAAAAASTAWRRARPRARASRRSSSRWARSTWCSSPWTTRRRSRAWPPSRATRPWPPSPLYAELGVDMLKRFGGYEQTNFFSPCDLALRGRALAPARGGGRARRPAGPSTTAW